MRCDIPANVYQSTFAPRTQWTEEFAQGAEIRDYWQGLARKHGVHRYLKLGHRVESAAWDDLESVWLLSIRDVQSSQVYTETADFVLTAIGRFNAWRLPEIPGMRDYHGLIRHSSDWDSTFDATGKNVAVIGNGASGIQLVPSMQKTSRRLDHHRRAPFVRAVRHRAPLHRDADHISRTGPTSPAKSVVPTNKDSCTTLGNPDEFVDCSDAFFPTTVFRLWDSLQQDPVASLKHRPCQRVQHFYLRYALPKVLRIKKSGN